VSRRIQRDAELPGYWDAGLPRRLFGCVLVSGASGRLRGVARLHLRGAAVFPRDVPHRDGKPGGLRSAL